MSPIIFFDGECLLCNGFVDFILKKDKKQIFKIASLQGETAKKLIPETLKLMDSVVYLEDQQFYIKYAAVAKIAAQLPYPYRFFMVAKFLPNFIYDFIAKNRYRWFGKRDACRLPQKGDQDRFLK